MTQHQQGADIVSFSRDVGSVGAVGIGLAYASGFLVLHLYLGQVGVVLFGLFNLTYLVAGLLFAFSLALVWIPAWRGELAVRAHAAQLRKQQRTEQEILSRTYPTRVITALLGWLVSGLVLNTVGVGLQQIVVWIVPAYIAHVLIIAIWRFSPTDDVDWQLRLVLFGLPSALLIWLTLCSLFAFQVYPHVYREIGGGKPVILELKTKTPLAASGSYAVLAVTDRYWIVKEPSDDTYLLLPAETVEAATFRRRSQIRLFPRR